MRVCHMAVRLLFKCDLMTSIMSLQDLSRPRSEWAGELPGENLSVFVAKRGSL